MWKQHFWGIVIATTILVSEYYISHFLHRQIEIHWGLKKATGEKQAEAGAELDAILEKHGAVYKGIC